VRTWKYISYACLSIPLAFLGLPLYVFIPKIYADLPGIGFGLAGIVIFCARLIDLITDPLMGFLGDRLRHIFHYFFWILIGCPMLIMGVYFLFNPPSDAGLGYLAFFLSLTYLGWTFVNVPYYAWGVELGKTEVQQRKIAAWREGAVLSGALVALIVVALSTTSPMLSLTITFSAILAFSISLIFFLPRASVSKNLINPKFRRIWINTSTTMRKLLSFHFFNALAAGIPATLFLIYITDVLGASEKQSGLLLLLYFVSGVIALPLWIKLANKIGEVVTWQLAIVVAVISFFPVIFIEEGQIWQFALVCIFTGATLGADIALPAALQARIAAKETRDFGFPREGASFGLWGLAGKLALACSVGLIFPILELFPSEENRAAALPWMYAFIPMLIKLGVFFGLHFSKMILTTIDKSRELKESDNETKNFVSHNTSIIIF
tara:strand:- start:1436 stop:2743 length:1308 start_codon:yes stop_codon:yes gene_type:complete